VQELGSYASIKIKWVHKLDNIPTHWQNSWEN